jgi:hypothetical protein
MTALPNQRLLPSPNIMGIPKNNPVGQAKHDNRTPTATRPQEILNVGPAAWRGEPHSGQATELAGRPIKL